MSLLVFGWVVVEAAARWRAGTLPSDAWGWLKSNWIAALALYALWMIEANTRSALHHMHNLSLKLTEVREAIDSLRPETHGMQWEERGLTDQDGDEEPQ
jgi:hypothetical protein